MSIENNESTDDAPVYEEFEIVHAGQQYEVPTVEEEATSPESSEDEVEAEDNAVDTGDEVTPEEEEVEETPAPKKKQTAQERINEVIRERNEERRKAADLEAELSRLKQGVTPPAKEAAAPTDLVRPSPNDATDDGAPKYPLGEYDPQYAADLAFFAAKQAVAEDRAKQAEQEKITAEEIQKQEIVTNWTVGLAGAQERYPDFQEKGEHLVDIFSGIPQEYGEYLTATLMSMDKGHDVLYYLANHLDVAEEIVNSGPTKAAIALGRLETQFLQSPPVKAIKVSNAPTPPPTVKGSAAVTSTLRADTDDLAEYERLRASYKK